MSAPARNGPAAPVFAVVGHPNKGKSSLVATLAMDDAVRIAPEPGTTTRAQRYPMRLDGEVLYTLVDTPGFQRARAALRWLREEAAREDASAAQRPEIVARFAAAPSHRERFRDEVELLTPILEGAGILYVVDGSVPYGSEYEAEMEILRWTGQPSLAVVNPIGGVGRADHAAEWETALGQYFRVVRMLDAVRADFEKRLDLLRAFGELREDWREPLRRAAAALEADRRRRRESAAREIATLLAEALTARVEKKVGPDDDPAPHRGALEERYRGQLRRLERDARHRVEAVYDFHELAVRESEDDEPETERALLDEDLFHEQTWLLFGLRRRDLVAAGAAGGALTGGSLDVALGGASFLAGATVGAAVGAALGWLGSDRLARLHVIDQPLGGKLLCYGPAQSPNLPFVLLGRARLHHRLVADRTHARRDPLDLASDAALAAGSQNPLDPDRRRALSTAFADLRKGRSDASERLTREIAALL